MKNEIIKIPKKRYRFHIVAEQLRIEELEPNLPEDEVFKYISSGGFSAIGFVRFIAEKTHINRLIVSTLRVGKKHLQVLDVLKNQGKLDDVFFIVGSLIKNDSDVGKSYKYYDNLLNICEKNNWKTAVFNNHSKVLLFDTEAGKYVIETSSNLNENPNVEQFSFEKNAELYNFYKDFFEKMIGDDVL